MTRTVDVQLGIRGKSHAVVCGDNTGDRGAMNQVWQSRRCAGKNGLRVDLLQSPTDTIATSRRYSVSYLWFPLPMTELRFVVRKSSSDSPDPFANGREYLTQLHVYF